MSHDIVSGPRRNGYSLWYVECSCGKPFTHQHRDAVLHLHEQHVHLEDARAALEEGRQS